MDAPIDPRDAAAPLRRGPVPSIVAGVVLVALLAAGIVHGIAPARSTSWDGPHPARLTAGAVPPGETTPEVPSDAIFVAADAGADGDGSRERPDASVDAALARIPERGTIVIRGGVYHESVFVGRSKTVEIRAYPGEAVWFDGTERIDGWVRDGEVWRAPWELDFSSAPSYTGGEDGKTETWRFLREDRPYAAHPEQLWIDDAPLRQVGVDEVEAGTFALDAERGELVLGSDPDGREVRASTLQRAFQIRSDDSVLAGIGVRRFAPSVSTMGAIVLEGDGVVVEDVVVEDASTTGLFVTGSGTTLRRLTVRGSGMIGIAANYADDLVLESVLLEGNNAEQFNHAPVSGGVKVTRSRHLRIADSVVRDNAGHGIWLDQSVYDAEIVSSDVLDNAGHGIFAEISQRVALVDLLVVGNDRIGIKINDTGDVVVWACTIVGNGIGVAVLQDDRRSSDPGVPGRDDRRPDPDPEMPWVVADVVIGSSILGAATGSPRDAGEGAPPVPLWVRDYSGEFAAGEMLDSVTGSVLQREERSDALASWQASAAGGALVVVDEDDMAALSGFGPGSVVLTGRDAVDEDLAPSRAALAAGATADEVPEVVARILGADAGVLGARVP